MSNQIDIQKSLDEIAELTAKQSELTKEKASLAKEMHEAAELLDKGPDNSDELAAQFDEMQEAWNSKDRQHKLAGLRRQTLEELTAQHAVHKQAVEGDERPMMAVADATAKLLHLQLSDIPVTEEDADHARASLKAQNVPFEEKNERLKINFEQMTTQQRGTGTGSLSDTVIPTDTYADFVDRVAAYGGALEAVRIQDTANAVPIDYPVIDFLAKIAQARTEGTTTPDGTLVTPTKVVFKPHLIQTGVHKITVQAIRDAAPDVMAAAYRQLARGMGVYVNNEITTGTGNGNGSTQGLVAGAKEATKLSGPTLTADAILDLIYAVDPAYRLESHGGNLMLGRIKDGKVCFMFHESVLRELMGLKDGEMRPLWLPDYRGGGTHTIFGYQYVVNQSMTQWGQDESSGSDRDVALFGNFDYYLARFVPSGSYTDVYMGDTYRADQVVGIAGFGEFCGAYCGGFSSGNTCEAVQKLAIAKKV